MKLKLRTLLIILNTVLIAALIPASVSANPTLPAGLVALYTFEEGTGTAVNDYSGVAPAMNLAIEELAGTSWTPAGAFTIPLADNGTILGEGVGDTDGLLDAKIAAAVRSTNQFTIEAWVTPAGDASDGISGPARIATLSDPAGPTGDRNFALMQDGDVWDARLRESTDADENPSDFNPTGGQGGTWGVDVGQLTYLVLTYDGSGAANTGVGTLYVLNPAASCNPAGAGYVGLNNEGNLSTWEDDFRFAIANEHSLPPAGRTARDWRGSLHMVAIYNQALDAGEIAANCAQGSRQIFDPLDIAKVFAPDTVEPGEVSTLTFTVTNPAGNPPINTAAFSDTLPAGVVIANPNGLATDCVGTITAVAGTDVISLADGVFAAGVDTCDISVDVTAAADGIYNNLSSVITSVQTQDSAAGASDTLTAGTSALTLTKAFAPDLIPPGGTSTITFNLNNPNSVVSATNVAFTDTLPTNVTVAIPSNATTDCGGTFVGAADTIFLTGGSLAAGASCSASIDVTSDITGSYNNTTSTITSNETPAGTAASDILDVVAGLGISKDFTPAQIEPNNVSTLSFIILNTSGVTANNVSFVDNLLVGVEVAATPNATNTCGGTFAPAATDTTLNLSGGTLGDGASCTLSVDVTAAVEGVYDNLSDPVTSDDTPDGNQASATLTVEERSGDNDEGDSGRRESGGEPQLLVVDPAISKRGSPLAAQPGEQVTFTIDVTNTGDQTATDVVVSDNVDPLFNIQSTSVTQGSTSVNGQQVTANIGTLNPGQTETITIVTTASNAAQPGALCNTASVSGNNLNSATSNQVCITISGESGLPGTLPSTGGEPVTFASQLARFIKIPLALLALLFVGYVGLWMASRRRRRISRW